MPAISTAAEPGVVGILLAAGNGTRFDASGRHNKLLAHYANGAVATSAARNLLAVLPLVLAVVRSGDRQTASALEAVGCRVVFCERADQGLSASLRCGLEHATSASGWVLALADMPRVQSATVLALVQTLAAGAEIAAPVFQGRRGNPVAFGRKHLAELLQLSGDAGARSLLATHPVSFVPVADPGILYDIDTRVDLARA